MNCLHPLFKSNDKNNLEINEWSYNFGNKTTPTGSMFRPNEPLPIISEFL